MRPLAALTILFLLLPACGDSSSNDNNTSQCEEGFRPEGPACVPIFDDCPGLAEIPVLGGGCQPVGVTECASGFESDGEGGCEPILPSEPCPPGTMEMIGNTECQPVGVIDCGDGFVSDGEGGCDAILPTEPCPWGYMEILGETECQPIGDCGTGTWGVIEIDATTVFVDATADATGADGSQGAPFVTIQEAYDVVVPGGQIAVAAGEYEERLVISKEVRLTGRCAELVTIRGAWWLGEPRPPLDIQAGGSGTTIKGLSMTGDAEGLYVDETAAVSLTECQVVDAGKWGVFAIRSGLSLDRVLVAGNAAFGIAVIGVEATITGSVVRDNVSDASGDFGRGINALCDSFLQICGRLGVSRSVVVGNTELGVAAFGTEATITGSVVSDTAPDASGEGGTGIGVQCDPDTQASGRLEVTGSLVAGNAEVGIRLFDAETMITGSVVADNVEAGVFVSGAVATITGSVVRDALPNDSGSDGRGINAQCDSDTQICGRLEVSGSVVAGNADVGVFVGGAVATITDSVVRDTAPDASGESSHGICAQCDPNMQICGLLEVSRSVVAGNRDFGVYVRGVEAAITGSVVRDTVPDYSSGGSRGISAQCDPDVRNCGRLEVSGSVVAGNAEAGVFACGVEATITGSVVRDTTPDYSGDYGRGISAQCDPGGQGCGHLEVCRSVAAGNAEAGVFVGGAEATITGSVVRDTVPGASGEGSRGIGAQCSLDGLGCGRLEVSSSLVAGNAEVGVFVGGVETTITGSVVRDTVPDDSGDLGRGVGAQCDPGGQQCGNLELSNSLIERSSNMGVFIAGVPATLAGVVVTDTRQNDDGRWGQGVYAMCYEVTSDCATLDMTACLVDSSFTAGVAVQGVSGSLQGSVVRQVVPRALDGAFGYGIQVEGIPGAPATVFDVSDSLIQDAELAGILYYLAGGNVSGSQIIGGQYSVVMNQGANPVVRDDNDLSGTIESEPTWVSMDPAPAPEPVPPIDVEM
ncbi:hypothetical protein ACFL51_00515 [Myxococcota bacterium]